MTYYAHLLPPWIILRNEMKDKPFSLLPRKTSVNHSELVGGGLVIQCTTALY